MSPNNGRTFLQRRISWCVLNIDCVALVTLSSSSLSMIVHDLLLWECYRMCSFSYFVVSEVRNEHGEPPRWFTVMTHFITTASRRARINGEVFGAGLRGSDEQQREAKVCETSNGFLQSNSYKIDIYSFHSVSFDFFRGFRSLPRFYNTRRSVQISKNDFILNRIISVFFAW